MKNLNCIFENQTTLNQYTARTVFPSNIRHIFTNPEIHATIAIPLYVNINVDFYSSTTVHFFEQIKNI